MEAKIEKLEVENKRFHILFGILIFLVCVAIALIQWSISDNADKRIAEQTELAKKEAKAEAKSGEILKAVNSSENRVITLTGEVQGYRKDVTKNTEVHEQSLKKFNELKNQNEKVYIPNATVEQQTDFITNYKYQPIGDN